MMVGKSIRFYLAGILLLLFGCAFPNKPLIIPGTPEDLRNCFVPYPAAPWESVHKIEALFGGKVVTSLLGITRGDPSTRRLQSVLLTPEGFSLFEGELQGGDIKIHRAVPPFDSPALAKGLLEDVALLFFPPTNQPTSWGTAADGNSVCRFEGSNGDRTEVRKSPDQGWRLLRWNNQGELIREVTLKGPFVHGLAADLELQALKPVSYKLKMTLIQSGS